MEIKAIHSTSSYSAVRGLSSKTIWFELQGEIPEIDFQSLIQEEIHRPKGGLVTRDRSKAEGELVTISLSVADSRRGYFGSVRFQGADEIAKIPNELRESILNLLPAN